MKTASLGNLKTFKWTLSMEASSLHQCHRSYQVHSWSCWWMLLFSCSKKLPSAKIFRCYLAVPASWAPHSDSCVANGSKAQHNQLSDQRLGEGRAKSMMEIGAAPFHQTKNDWMNGILEAWSSDHKRPIKRFKTQRYSWMLTWCSTTSFVPTICSRFWPLKGSSAHIDPISHLKTSHFSSESLKKDRTTN